MIDDCLDIREVSNRYKRIIQSLIRCCNLTYGEAVSCVNAFKRGDSWAGEAVNHFGGTTKCIQQAFHYRKLREVKKYQLKLV